ncbi:MAG: DUF1802 family protein, partial [Limisphaerales bacterium]
VLPVAQKRFDEIALQFSPPTILRLEFLAKVVAWKQIDSLALAEKLRGQHLWRDEVIAERFDWGKNKNIFALAVRVFQLPQKIELTMAPGYGGCKSWIEFEREIKTDSARPVLSEDSFAQKLNKFQQVFLD